MLAGLLSLGLAVTTLTLTSAASAVADPIPAAGTGSLFTLPAVAAKVYPGAWNTPVTTLDYFTELSVGESANVSWYCYGTCGTASVALVAGDSVTLSGTKVNAVKPGTSVVGVSFSGLPENTTLYAMYTVKDTDTSPVEISTSMTRIEQIPNISNGPISIDYTAYDTLYFDHGTTTPYDFTVDAPGAVKLEVSVNGSAWGDAKNAAATTFKVNLEARNNIIGVRATDANGKTREFWKTLNARFAAVQLTNETRPGASPAVGDKVSVHVAGVMLPISRVSGVFNPQSDGIGYGVDVGITSYVRYESADYDNYGYGWVRGKGSQYNLASANSFSLTLNKPGELKFTGGTIVTMWWGTRLGCELKNCGAVYAPPQQTQIGLDPKENAPQFAHVGSWLPDFTLQVAEKADDVIHAQALHIASGVSGQYGASLTIPEYHNSAVRREAKDTYNVTWSVFPAEAVEREVIWESNNPAVARIVANDPQVKGLPPDSSGGADIMLSNVFPIKANDGSHGFRFIETGHYGTATITGTIKGTNITATLTVTVAAPQVTTTLSPTKYVYANQALTLSNAVSNGTLTSVQRIVEQLEASGNTAVQAFYSYETDLPGMAAIKAPISLPSGAGSVTFTIPSSAALGQAYGIKNGQVIIEYLDSDSVQQTAIVGADILPTALADQVLNISDPNQAVLQPEHIYPGSTVDLTYRVKKPSVKEAQKLSSAIPKGQARITDVTLHWSTDIPRLPTITSPLLTSSAAGTATFTIPADTPPGTYHLTDPGYRIGWEELQNGRVVARGTVAHAAFPDKDANNPDADDPSVNPLYPQQFTITVTEKPKSYAYFAAERSTLGLPLLVEPVKVEIEDGVSTVWDVVKQQLGEANLEVAQTSPNGGTATVYLQGVKNADMGSPNIPDYISWLDGIGSNGPTTADALAYGQNKDFDATTLAEFDYSDQSGWVFLVNSQTGSYGLEQQVLHAGDVVRLAFTFNGLGLDLGGGFGGGDPAFNERYAFANFDALIPAIADAATALAANTAPAANTTTASNTVPAGVDLDALRDVYDEAQTLLLDMVSSQSRIDYLVSAIRAILAGEEPGAYAPSVNKDALAVAIAAAEDVTAGHVAEDYLAATWNALQRALASARVVFGNANASQAQVNNAAGVLNTAVGALTLLPPVGEVALPAAVQVKAAYEAVAGYENTVYEPDDLGYGAEWVVLGLARGGALTAGQRETYLTHLANAVDEMLAERADGKLSLSSASENERVILALSALGVDATQFNGHDLVAALADADYVKRQGINGSIFALLALDAGGYEVPTLLAGASGTQTTRAGLIAEILGAQLPSGGWNLSGFGEADPDVTAMALQALAPYGRRGSVPNAQVTAAISRALDALSGMQQLTGGFAAWGEVASESAAQVLVALSALGIPLDDARFVKGTNTVWDAFITYQLVNGAFEHIAGSGADGMATEQAAYALNALYRALRNQNALYDMSDVPLTAWPTLDEPPAPVAEPPTLVDEPPAVIDVPSEAVAAPTGGVLLGAADSPLPAYAVLLLVGGFGMLGIWSRRRMVAEQTIPVHC
ncbi:MAG: hypothetical protein LBC29_04020 [Propionibacteriaceae bacterium]|jgi:hypothetical protein|nr:hypothetical protein [Propionibacteriaceae bacterium]